jgi:hypothetical protein
MPSSLPVVALPPIAYTTEEAAAILRRGRSTLEKWRQQRLGPPFIRNPDGTGVLYTHAGLVQWLAEQEQLELAQRRPIAKRAKRIRRP